MNTRILIVDDNPSIHDDFEKILPTSADEEAAERNALFDDVLGTESDEAASNINALRYQLDHAYQGQEALDMVETAEKEGKPYALIFMDVRMPPGWDGIESINQIWSRYPHIEMVICTAYSDYSWAKILAKIGSSDQLQFIRKPIDIVSIKQMALALVKKWNLARKVRQYVDDLEVTVAERTKDLATKVDELEAALTEIKQLQGIIPMCSYCHKIRDDTDFWHRVDEYIQNHSVASISHGVCPECYDKIVAPMFTAEDAGDKPASADA
jgi:CheY-like chemotaxis protein